MIILISALAQNRVIGNGPKIPWHLTTDLKRFKRLTMGHPVVMGRKTFEAVGKPLPGRRNIVITRDIDWQHRGVEVFHSIDQLLPKMQTGTWFICGGGDIYKLFLPHADKMYLTHIDARFEGDAFFPEFDEHEWIVEHAEQHSADDFFPHSYSFVDYARRR